MLKNLYIKNFTLINELEVNFAKGLNVITGETGAGKSILIDAIDLAFGARSSKEQIKTGEQKANIELQVQISDSFPLELLEENGIEVEEDTTLVFSREINQNGTKSRINGVLVTQNYVQEIKKHLIDIHSQHETYTYIQPKTHIDLLDNYGDNWHKSLLVEYKDVYSSLIPKKKRLDFLKSQNTSVEQKMDFLKFQINEIEEANIETPHELDELNQERSVLLNVEELKELTYSSYYTLYGGDTCIIDVLNQLENKIIKASELDKNLSVLADTIANSAINLKEVSNELRDYSQNLETNEQRLLEIDERIAVLEKLKRKYGKSLQEILDHLETFRHELKEIEFGTEQLETLEIEIEQLGNKAHKLADSLTQSRQKLAGVLSELIINELVKLEMPKAEFKINVTTKEELSLKGLDDVEFLISTNPGEPVKPMAKIASGGEISRVMLAVKTVFAISDSINTVIFDEIDSGISGKASQAVAEALASLSKTHQLLCITHQPIIAAMADNHLYVEKIQNETSTESTIKALNEKEQIQAISKLASGQVDQNSLDFAKKLISKSQEYKESLMTKAEQC